MTEAILSLCELNNLVKGVIQNSLTDKYWIRAEMSDVRVNQNGHCYLEFIEKDAKGRTVIAKSRAMIWANTFFILRAYFENTTHQSFASGLKVLVKVSVEFHELYGFSLTVHDIDPSYTLGDQARNRLAILKQLEEDGVLEMNRELELAQPLNRIAIISSPTAAGYEDFCNQLQNNAYGFVFYTKLFSAVMQGNRAEESIISALESIYSSQESFDAVVIIRGGGATSELSCFDSYLLAASCAQFPLPIITGIGHERDETVLDVVAHTRAKTPTAVAEFLIGEMLQIAGDLDIVRLGLVSSVNKHLQEDVIKLATYKTQIVSWLKNWERIQYSKMAELIDDLQKASRRMTQYETNRISVCSEGLRKYTELGLKENKSKLDIYEKYINLMSPDNILRKGYSITTKNGKTIKGVFELKKGDVLTTLLKDGSIESIVK